MAIGLIVLGLVGLWLGTRWIITGAIGIAKRFNLSDSFVGIAILAIGTDLPEVFISAKASILQLQGEESSGIITGNAIGSSVSQISLVLGIAGLFLVFRVARREVYRDGIALLASLILVYIFGLDGMISRIEGVALLVVYVIYYVVLVKTRSAGDERATERGDHSPLMLAVFLLAGFGVLIGSSHLVVENAMALAEKWGVAESFVGIVIIGIGTSLPELAVAVGAALKRSAAMSVGNVIGSNIFDGLIPIGLGGTISTISMEQGLMNLDLPVLFAVSLLVLIFLWSKRGISTPEAIVLLVIYAGYIAAKVYLM